MRSWYCTDAPQNWYHTERLLYVHPLHRRTRHAAKLFLFARWWSEQTGLPVLLGLMPRRDLNRKADFYRRHAMPIGGLFLVGPSLLTSPHVGTA